MNTSELGAKVGQLDGWAFADDGRSIRKSYDFKDFALALSFVNRVGALAEEEQHHPDIDLHWGRVGVTLSTHSEGGVSEKDIELAKKIDTL